MLSIQLKSIVYPPHLDMTYFPTKDHSYSLSSHTHLFSLSPPKAKAKMDTLLSRIPLCREASLSLKIYTFSLKGFQLYVNMAQAFCYVSVKTHCLRGLKSLNVLMTSKASGLAYPIGFCLLFGSVLIIGDFPYFVTGSAVHFLNKIF